MNSYRPSIAVSRQHLHLLPYLFAGFLPVSAIALHCMDIIDIRASLAFLIIPVFTFLIDDISEHLSLLRFICKGWLAGIISVGCYDLSRIPFIYLGWNDFIPNIGAWLCDSAEPNAVLGYLWRYIGNGGGLGISFFLLVKMSGRNTGFVRAGIAYGMFIFLCLAALLCFFPNAQQLMFHVTLVSFSGGMVGHLVYGLVLGIIYKRWIDHTHEITSPGH